MAGADAEAQAATLDPPADPDAANQPPDGRRGWVRRGAWTGRVEVEGFFPTDGYRWIAHAGLPQEETSLLLAIMSRVDKETWRWPPKVFERGGSSVADLAALTGRCKRQVRRNLRKLEARGVLITWDRRPMVNAYQLVPVRLKQLAEEANQQRRAAANERRLAQAAEAMARLPSEDQTALDVTVKQQEAAPAPQPAPAADMAPQPAPFWAMDHAKRLGRQADEVLEVVTAAVAAVRGPEAGAHPEELGSDARPVLRLWSSLGFPGPERLAGELELVAAAAKSCMDPRWHEVRGLNRRSRRAGADRSGHVGELCKQSEWSTRVRLARVHAKRTCPCPPPAEPDPPTVQATSPPEIHVEGWLLEAWTGWLACLIDHIGLTNVEVWLRPLVPLDMTDTRLVIGAPNPYYQQWTQENYAGRLAEITAREVVVVLLSGV